VVSIPASSVWRSRTPSYRESVLPGRPCVNAVVVEASGSFGWPQVRGFTFATSRSIGFGCLGPWRCLPREVRLHRGQRGGFFRTAKGFL